MIPVIDSRAVTGLRPPRSISTNIAASRGGLAVHYGGDAQGLPASVDHSACHARVRGWQDFHMDTRGWVDLAYNWVICNHGRIMVGRGWGVRSAANGTNDANDRYLAACWLGGGSESPSQPAIDAYGWLIAEIRGRGAGRDVQPHRTFFPTDCPGNALAAHCGLWRLPQHVPTAPAPAFPLAAGQWFGPVTGGQNSISGYYTHRSDLARWQVRASAVLHLGLVGDGLYGPKTRAAALALQHARGLVQDALIGRKTWDAAWR